MAIADRIEEMYTHVGDVYDTIRNVDLPEDKNIENIPRTVKDSYLEMINNGTQQVWDNWDKVNGTGTTLTLNNTEEAPMSLVYKGNTLQNGTPTPDSPIPIQVVSGDNSIVVCGKNLAPTDWASKFVNAVNVDGQARLTIKDNRNCLRYQPQAGYGSYPTKNFTLGMTFKENTQYTISYDILKESTNRNTIGIFYTDGTASSNTNVSAIDTWEHQTITSTAGKTIDYLAPYYTSGYTYIDLNTWQIEEGTTATTYEAYTGASYPISLGIENLFDKDNANVFNGYWSNNTLIAQSNSYGVYISCQPNTTYTISKHVGTTFRIATTINTPANNVSTISSTANHTGTNITITTEANAKYIWVNYYGSTDTYGQQDMLNSIEIVKGSTPSRITDNPIELLKIGTYQDRIFKNTPNTTDYNSELEDNVWYVKKEIGKVVLDGSEVWTKHASIASWFYCDGILDGYLNNAESNFALCDHFIQNRYSSVTTLTNGQFAYGTSDGGITHRLVMKDTDYTETQDFRNWLSNNPTNLYYVLATPTYTLIEDSTLIEELESMKKSKEGQTNITQVNNDMPFELNAEALKGDE